MSRYIYTSFVLILCLAAISCCKNENTKMEAELVPEGIPAEKIPATTKAIPVPEKITKLPTKCLFPAGATTIISLAGDDAVWIHWQANLTVEEAKKCKNKAIKVSVPERGVNSQSGEIRVPSAHGEIKMNFTVRWVNSQSGGILAPSAHGEISARITNLEDFPIEVEIWTEKQ